MKEIRQESVHVNFDVQLPPSRDVENEIEVNIARKSPMHRGIATQFIPRSHIARQLETKLQNIANFKLGNEHKDQQDKVESDHNTNTNWNVHVKLDDGDRIFAEIIDTFRQLFQKYVDAQRAVFMINISSGKRNELMRLFDTRYYNSFKMKQNKINSQGVSNTKRIFNVSLLTQRSNQLASGSDRNDANAVRQRSMINEKLDERILRLKSSATSDFNNETELQRAVLKWLLLTIMETFEGSVREIAFLMNDSFSRFRTNHNDLYDKLRRFSTTSIK